MAKDEFQQLKGLLDESKNILIMLPKHAGGDVIASSTALLLYLKKKHKTPHVIGSDFVLPQTFSFLPHTKDIKSEFRDLRKFIVSLDIKQTGLRELSYDVHNDKLRIYVTPKKGFLQKDNVRTAQSDFRYDLIITLGAQDFDSLGHLYQNNTELFHTVPLVNIDCSPTNEQYGSVNLVDITVTSVAEVVFAYLEKIDAKHIDNDVATALLTAIIANTHSFKARHVKPRTLSTASTLMRLGANREDIVTHLYRTRSVAALKLWGRALENLRMDKQTGIYLSTITREEFMKTEATHGDLNGVIEELMINAPEAKAIVLLHEAVDTQAKKNIHGIVYVIQGYDARLLTKTVAGAGTHGVATFETQGSLKGVAEQITNQAKN